MRAKRGQALRWLLDALDRETDECVLWPFAKMETGYGQVQTGRKLNLVHRIACLATHGSPKTDQTDAAHSCGNRACVNSRHLRWSTRRENQRDKVGHGTVSRGEKIHGAKLTEDKVRAIRSDARPHKSIAAQYGVNALSIGRIKNGHSWAWVV